MGKIKDFFKRSFEEWRINLIFLLFFAFGVFVIARFYNLQILKRDSFAAAAASQIEAQKGDWQYLRGKIYFQDKKGDLIPAAITKNFPRIYAVPKEIKDPISVSEKIVSILGGDQNQIAEMLAKPNDLFELIEKKADLEKANQIKSLKISGIYVDEAPRRYYPNKTMASQLLGFVKDDDKNFHGQYGLEKQYDSKLSAVSSEKEDSNLFDKISLINSIFSRNNWDLIATIDYNLQKKAEELLEKGIKEWEAESGSVIVMNPQNGKILTLANYPNFDPNDYSIYPFSSFIDPVVELTYEPGSVFKVITVAAGIENKKINPKTTYNDTGEIKVDGKTIRNWDLKAYGLQDITGILAHSLNLGAVFVEKTLGHDLFYQSVVNFGIGEKTGIDLPGELKGRIGNLRGFQEVYFATASFGQGITATPLSMISAISAVANKGVMMKPYVTEKIIGALDNQEEIFSPKERRRVLSEETAKTLRMMMVESVERNKVAAIKGYQIAGKTGTAQMADENGSYSKDDYIHSFVGFGPAEDPKFIILVKLNKPKKAKLAGTTAIPIFRELMRYALNYYEISPTQ